MACGVLPVGLRIAQLYVDSGESTQAACQEAADACRNIAKTAASPEWWDIATDIFATVGDETVPLGDAITAATTTEEMPPLLKALASLLLTLRSDCLPDTAVRLQLRYIPYVLSLLVVSRRIVVRILAPYFHRYWSAMINAAGFRFRTPMVLKKKLKDCENMIGTEQIKAILRNVSEGLDVPLSKEMLDWLSSEA